MKRFVSLRVRKLHDWGLGSHKNGKEISGVEGLTAHDLRLIFTPNADPERLRLNPICCEETEWQPTQLTKELAEKIGADRSDFFSKKAKARIEKLGISDKKRNSCKVANLMLMVSPQWFRDGNETIFVDEGKAKKWIQLANDFMKVHFGDNFLGAVAHLDELNPHLSAYVLPAVEKNRKNGGRPSQNKERESTLCWGLDSKSLFTPDDRISDPSDKTGKRKIRIPETGTCSRLQTNFAEFCQKHGLDVVRGIVGSRSKYQEISIHNHLLRMQTLAWDEVENIKNIEFLRQLVIAGKMKAEDYNRVSRELENIQSQLAEEQKPLLLANAILREEKEVLADHNQILANKLEIKTRAIPVGKLIEKLAGVEGTSTENGREIYVLHTGMRLEVELETNRFRNLTPKIQGAGNMREKAGGKGGIEMAIFLTGCTRDAAVLLTSDLFSIDAAAATVAKEIEDQPKTPEREALAKTAETIAEMLCKPDETNWPKVQKALTETLNLDEQHITELKKDGLIYANSHGHLVTNRFQQIESQEQFSGAIIQDCIPDNGFYMETGDNGHALIYRFPNAKTTVVVDDPLEALALHSHHQAAGIAHHIVVIGRQKSQKTIAFLRALAKVTALLVTASQTIFGKHFVNWIKEIIPAIQEIRPPKGWISWGEYNRRLKPEIDPKV